MATNDTPSPSADTGTAAASPAPAPRRRVGTALAITGIAVGSVLTLGLTFAGGVALGQVLPGSPAPISGGAEAAPIGPMGERIGERIEQRMDERQEQRQEQRDERRAQFEQWLRDQGIDPSAPLEPTP